MFDQTKSLYESFEWLLDWDSYVIFSEVPIFQSTCYLKMNKIAALKIIRAALKIIKSTTSAE